MGKKNRGNVANGENTVIGAGTTVNGNIVSDSAVIRVDGQVNGGINTQGDLVVGTMGVVSGDVFASSVNLAGKIVGDVEASKKIEIESKGKLLGNIKTKLLAIDETGVIQGNVNMSPDEEEEKDKDSDKKEDDKKEDPADEKEGSDDEEDDKDKNDEKAKEQAE